MARDVSAVYVKLTYVFRPGKTPEEVQFVFFLQMRWHLRVQFGNSSVYMPVAVVRIVARSCDPNTRLPPPGQVSTLLAVEEEDQLFASINTRFKHARELGGAGASSANAGVIFAAIMSEAVPQHVELKRDDQSGTMDIAEIASQPSLWRAQPRCLWRPSIFMMMFIARPTESRGNEDALETSWSPCARRSREHLGRQSKLAVVASRSLHVGGGSIFTQNARTLRSRRIKMPTPNERITSGI